MNVDVHIKDEGDFATVCFMTDEAKENIQKENLPDDMIYGEEVLKMDIMVESVKEILLWCVSHDLSVNSEYTLLTYNKQIVNINN